MLGGFRRRVLSARYQLIRALGEGGQGEVYLAYDQKLHRQVAIKRVVDREGVGAITNLGLDGLKHPAIATTFNIERILGETWIVSEFVGGLALHQKQTFLLREFCRWLRQVCDALVAMHSAGWIHGDVSPANIVIDMNGDARLIDAALAARTGSPWCGRGTPAFTPTEVISADTAVDSFIDCYAVGGLIRWALGRESSNGLVDDAGVHHCLSQSVSQSVTGRSTLLDELERWSRVLQSPSQFTDSTLRKFLLALEALSEYELEGEVLQPFVSGEPHEFTGEVKRSMLRSWSDYAGSNRALVACVTLSLLLLLMQQISIPSIEKSRALLPAESVLIKIEAQPDTLFPKDFSFGRIRAALLRGLDGLSQRGHLHPRDTLVARVICAAQRCDVDIAHKQGRRVHCRTTAPLDNPAVGDWERRLYQRVITALSRQNVALVGVR